MTGSESRLSWSRRAQALASAAMMMARALDRLAPRRAREAVPVALKTVCTDGIKQILGRHLEHETRRTQTAQAFVGLGT
ncbi:MAG TPA: hypothetical protein VFS67_16185 [Polyangiaceae bacterium]|nr:hypothetical protein [Polyangiaceae bacterium]